MKNSKNLQHRHFYKYNTFFGPRIMTVYNLNKCETEKERDKHIKDFIKDIKSHKDRT